MTNKLQKPVSFWRWDLVAGLASGFPLCCVFYYLLRNLTELKPPRKSKRFGLYGYVYFWLDIIFDPYKDKNYFVCCPIHHLLKKDFVWYKCQNEGCRWEQVDCDECAACKIRLPWREDRKPMKLKDRDCE